MSKSITERNVQRNQYFFQRCQRQILFTAFNLANISWMNVGHFGQCFLRQARLQSVGSYPLADGDSNHTHSVFSPSFIKTV